MTIRGSSRGSGVPFGPRPLTLRTRIENVAAVKLWFWEPNLIDTGPDPIEALRPRWPEVQDAERGHGRRLEHFLVAPSRESATRSVAAETLKHPGPSPLFTSCHSAAR